MVTSEVISKLTYVTYNVFKLPMSHHGTLSSRGVEREGRGGKRNMIPRSRRERIWGGSFTGHPHQSCCWFSCVRNPRLFYSPCVLASYPYCPKPETRNPKRSEERKEAEKDVNDERVHERTDDGGFGREEQGVRKGHLKRAMEAQGTRFVSSFGSLMNKSTERV